MSQLAKAAAWLGRTMARHNSSASEDGRTVYCLHGSHKIEVRASFGSTEIEVTDTSGQLTTERTRDFLVNTDELVADGHPFEPTADTRFLEELVIGTTTHRWLYDVIAIPGQGTFAPVDNHRTRVRVFTKLSSNQSNTPSP